MTKEDVLKKVNGKTVKLHEVDNTVNSTTGAVTLVFDYDNGEDVFARKYLYDLTDNEVFKVETWNLR